MSDRLHGVLADDAGLDHCDDVFRLAEECDVGELAPCRNTSLPWATERARWTARWMPSVRKVYGGSPGGTDSGT